MAQEQVSDLRGDLPVQDEGSSLHECVPKSNAGVMLDRSNLGQLHAAPQQLHRLEGCMYTLLQKVEALQNSDPHEKGDILEQRLEELMAASQRHIQGNSEVMLYQLKSKTEEIQAALHYMLQQQRQMQAESEDSLARRLGGDFQRAVEKVLQLRVFEQAVGDIQERLVSAEAQVEVKTAELNLLQSERTESRATIERLELLVENMQDTSESQRGQWEAELLEKSLEAAGLRRQVEQQRRQLEELTCAQEAEKAELLARSQEAAELRRQVEQQRGQLEDLSRVQQAEQAELLERRLEAVELRRQVEQQQRQLEELHNVRRAEQVVAREEPQGLAQLFVQWLREETERG